MAKSRKSGAEVLLDMVARMPWWAGVVLAVVAYVVLRTVAQAPVAPGRPGEVVGPALVRGLASALQYVLPLIFLLGAAVSAFKRRQSSQLHAEAANRTDAVAQMDWRKFEALVGEYFRRQGYTVIETGGGGPDGGVDVLLQKGSDRYLVQCKHWRALRVGVAPVRELYGAMAARRVAGGFLVTSGDFTEEARRFAQGREVQLINGKKLMAGIRKQAGAVRVEPELEPPATQATSVPACPLCNAPMVLRQARTGPMAGHRFWGCSTFAQTKCRGTREL